MSTSIDNISREIVKNLEGYTESVREGIDRERKKVAKKTTEVLKSTSPKRTGKYKKGWKEKDETVSGQSGVSTIHNKKHYRLTHLLENGHNSRNGRWIAARPHIKAVEEAVVAEFTEAAERVIRNGG